MHMSDENVVYSPRPKWGPMQLPLHAFPTIEHVNCPI